MGVSSGEAGTKSNYHHNGGSSSSSRISFCYKEVHTHSKGRCLVAAPSPSSSSPKELPAGSVVISCGSEAYVPVATEAAQRCWTCLQVSPSNLSKCRACKWVRYCSRRCQAQDWTLYHKHECAALQRFLTSPPAYRPTSSLILAARVLRKAMTGVHSIEDTKSKYAMAHSIKPSQK